MQLLGVHAVADVRPKPGCNGQLDLLAILICVDLGIILAMWISAKTFLDDVIFGRANNECRIVSNPRKHFRGHFPGSDHPIVVLASEFNNVPWLTGPQDNGCLLGALPGSCSRITHQRKAIGVKNA